jgi:hypothetical protein
MSIKPNWTLSTPAVPGIPEERFVVPMVRVNGMETEMTPGMKIPHQFLPAQLAGGLSQAQAVQAVIDATDSDDIPPAILDQPQIPTIHTGTNAMYMGKPDEWIIIQTPAGPFKVPGYAIV